MTNYSIRVLRGVTVKCLVCIILEHFFFKNLVKMSFDF